MSKQTYGGLTLEQLEELIENAKRDNCLVDPICDDLVARVRELEAELRAQPSPREVALEKAEWRAIATVMRYGSPSHQDFLSAILAAGDVVAIKRALASDGREGNQ